MGVASSIFEPQPCNFRKLDIFLRCLNDMISDLQKSSSGPNRPSNWPIQIYPQKSK